MNGYTVKELIEALEKCEQDKEVVVVLNGVRRSIEAVGFVGECGTVDLFVGGGESGV